MCSAQQRSDAPTLAERCTSAVLSAAVAASMIASPPVALAARARAPEPEQKSFGAQRTEKLIQDAGTPEAVRPDSMKTNVPFQAPGINAPPRGRGQEQGTSPKQVFKDIKEQVKENFPDPDSARFGVGKGPLVRDAKKMQQPGKVQNLNKEGAFRFKKMSADTEAAQRVEKDPSKPEKRGVITGGWTTAFGGRNQ